GVCRAIHSSPPHPYCPHVPGAHIWAMSSPVPKYVPPSITETAFNCPHCGALANQTWFHLKAETKKSDELPLRLSEDTFNRATIEEIEDKEERENTLVLADRIIAG